MINCDKENCELRGQQVWCLGYERYPYRRCTFYNTRISDPSPRRLGKGIDDKTETKTGGDR